MEGVKIYGLCLERLRHQLTNAKKKLGGIVSYDTERILLESYNTADLNEIIDILELYDVQERTFEKVKEKLEELSFTVSELTRETLLFDYTDEGHLGLYLGLREASVLPLQEEGARA